MEQNKFEITGRCNYVDVKYNNDGFCIVRTAISKKNKRTDEYDSFFITFLGDNAESYATKIKKGDVVNIVGYLEVNKYKKDGKEISSINIVGKEFTKAKFDEKKKCYVSEDGKEDDKPW